MMDRKVTHTGKANDGTITSLCNPQSSWRKVSSSEAINHIKNKIHRYYVRVKNYEVDIHVAKGETGEYLRTDWDNTEKNNLLRIT